MNDAPFQQLQLSIEEQIQSVCTHIHAQEQHHTQKVLTTFQQHGVSERHLHGSTGYGYHDVGRDTLDRIFAQLCGAEAAIVRPHINSGTHAIAIALMGILRPGDELLYITGEPYDTLRPVLGIHQTEPTNNLGSLRDWGINTTVVPLTAQNTIDWTAVQKALHTRTKVIALQRSRGYSLRPAMTANQLREAVQWVRQHAPHVTTFVDNCYGEWVERVEPTDDSIGIDLMAGSLIKNAGGGLAPTGGYIAGRAALIERVAQRVTAPGVGNAIGSYEGGYRSFYQGVFLAPHFVAQSLQGMIFTAAWMERLGLWVSPRWDEPRADIIQAIRLDSEQALIAFIQAVQKSAPIDAHVTPIPAPVPGYDRSVIMAAGSFIQGGSLELSADAPIHPPYVAYMQGGVTTAHVKWAVQNITRELIKGGHLSI